MSFEIHQQAEQRFVVVDAQTGQATRGRFHTRQAAQEWVDERARKALLALVVPQTRMGGRARAYQLTSSDYSGDNERRIQRITESIRSVVIL